MKTDDAHIEVIPTALFCSLPVHLPRYMYLRKPMQQTKSFTTNKSNQFQKANKKFNTAESTI